MHYGMYKRIMKYAWLRYSCVGVINTLVYSSILWLMLQKVYLSIVWSTSIATVISMIFQFLLNKIFTFKSHHFCKYELVKYFSMVVFNYCNSLLCLKLLINYLHVQVQLAVEINILLLIISGYLISNYWVFKK